ncbi:hypothetical protein [Geopsychrobacter electrodiphilus]|uniref:hypothetical protein n=1 Tax=Geopsychrobacter electrodiphilus TaxID=225196 RepID=UPI00036C7627|nr:hypothetical protein [Geopsychrobacter electrodiphilus]
MAAFGIVGTIAAVIFAIIAFLAPIWLYFINVYTGSSRDELRKINKNLETLISLINKNNTEPAQPQKQLAGSILCPACKNKISYPEKYAGQIKPCPKCGETLRLS